MIDLERDLEDKWSRLMKLRPDFVKTYLQHSDERAERHGKEEFFGHTALHPELLEKIVVRAHAHGLRVSCHIETATDFHNALLAGVDEVCHMPRFWVEPGVDLEPYRIAEADAALAARNGTVVVTTISLSSQRYADQPEHLERLLANHAQDLALLSANGVSVAVGSDRGDDTSRDEVAVLRKLGMFDDLTLLKMSCETTPATVCPARRIGKLEEGYEASFLVLEGNALEDWGNVDRIRQRFKQGHRLP